MIHDFFQTVSGVSGASTRELLRSGLTATIILLSFAAMLSIFLTIDLLSHSGDSLRKSLGVVSAMGMASIAFTGTSVPLVTYRERGTMSLLRSTPLSRIAFLCGQVPVRAMIAFAELVIISLVIVALGERDLWHIASLAVTSLIGFLMFMSLGFLLGARGANSDFTMQVSLIFPILVIFTSGIGIPLDALPLWANSLVDALPTTWFMDALNSWTGVERGLPLPINWILMITVAILSTLLAAVTFDWGRND